MDDQAHAIIQCNRCGSSFEPARRITDPKAFDAFVEAVAMLNCPYCYGIVPLDTANVRFALTDIPTSTVQSQSAELLIRQPAA
jgi:hypothetical protein